MNPKWTFNTQVSASLTLAIAIFMGIGFLFYRNMTDTIEAVHLGGHSYEMNMALEHLFSDLKDAETGQRGYLLTQNENYLQPYLQSLQTVHQKFDRLSTLSQNNKLQRQRVTLIGSLMQAKLQELGETITLSKTQGFTAALKLVKTNRGKIYMDQIRQVIEVMEVDNQKLIDKQSLLIEQGFRLTTFSSAIGGILALGILILVYGLLMREMTARQLANTRLEAEIVERKRIEEQIQQLNINLEKQVIALDTTNQELESFAYSVSHDLRAPLRSIDGFSKMLLDKAQDKLNPEEHHYLENVCENTKRMGELIDDLLKLSRLTRSEMKHEHFDLSMLVKDIFEEYRKRDPDREVQLEVTEGLLVNGDINLLKIMLENLLGNAWKFTAKTEVARIKFGMQKNDDDKPVYYIRDNGAGFNMKYADKLFGVFQRLHQMAEFPGTGIGLATVQRVMRRHGGKVWAEGEENKGATFYFSF